LDGEDRNEYFMDFSMGPLFKSGAKLFGNVTYARGTHDKIDLESEEWRFKVELLNDIPSIKTVLSYGGDLSNVKYRPSPATLDTYSLFLKSFTDIGDGAGLNGSVYEILKT
jgi:hypothetical protein